MISTREKTSDLHCFNEISTKNENAIIDFQNLYKIIYTSLE